MDKAALLARRLPEDTHDIEGVGTVRLRGLSRGEAIKFRGIEDDAAGEQFIVSRAMLDPAMTPEDVAAWQDAATHGEFDKLTDKISELSGMAKNNARKVVEEFEADPSAEFRDAASAEPGNDAGAPA